MKGETWTRNSSTDDSCSGRGSCWFGHFDDTSEMSAGTVEVRFLICPRSPSLAIGHDTRVQVLSPKVLDSRFHTRAPVATMLRSATFSVLVDILETVVSASSECWRIWLGGERLSTVLFSWVAGFGKGSDRVHRLSLVATATCFCTFCV